MCIRDSNYEDTPLFFPDFCGHWKFQRLKDDGRIDPVFDIPTLARVVVTIGDGMFWRRAVDPAFDVNRLLPAILETIGLLMRPVVNETPGKTLAPKTAEPA